MYKRQERAARAAAAQAAIRAIDSAHNAIAVDLDEAGSARCADVSARVMDQYRRRLTAFSDGSATPRAEAKQAEAMELQMRIAAVRAERSMLYRMRSQQRITDETLTKLIREIDLQETALSTRKKGLA